MGVWDRRTAELSYCEGVVGEGKESGLGMEKRLSRDRTALGRGEGEGEVKVSLLFAEMRILVVVVVFWIKL